MKDLSEPNRAALLKQAIHREFPDAHVAESGSEFIVFLGEPPHAFQIVVTRDELLQKTLDVIVFGVVSVAAQQGLKSATAIAAEKQPAE